MEEVTNIIPVGTTIISEELKPGVVIDDPSLVADLMNEGDKDEEKVNVKDEDVLRREDQSQDPNCYAAILLGIDCELSVDYDDGLEKAERKSGKFRL